MLQENWAYLVENITVTPGDILDHLLAEDVISQAMYEEIGSKGTNRLKVVTLLNMIMKRPDSFPIFCEALRDSYQEFVAAKLEHSLESIDFCGSYDIPPGVYD